MGPTPSRGDDRNSDRPFQNWIRCLTSKTRKKMRNKKLNELKPVRALREMLED